MDLEEMSQQNGAPAEQAPHYFPLSIRKFFSGYWTQLAPFSGPDDRQATKFLGGRPDILTDGLNVELTNYGTITRRPGLIAYSDQTLPTPIKGFYSFRRIADNTANPFDVIVDTKDAIYNITPTAKTLIRTKAAGADQAYFLGLGNSLFFGDGAEELVWSDPSAKITGVCNTSGTSVTWVSNSTGNTDVGNRFGTGDSVSWIGQPIIINGTTYTVASVTDATHLTLTSSAGTQTNVGYTFLTRKWGLDIGLFSGISGPNLPSDASDVSIDGATAWSDIANVETEDGTYASVALNTVSTNSIGPSFPGDASDLGSSWSSPGSVEAEDGSLSTFSLSAGEQTSKLLANNPGFNIPSNAKILGVKVEVKVKQTSGTSALYGAIKLNGASSSTKSDAYGTDPWTTTLSYHTFGGATDLWGATLTPSIINGSSFGAQFWASATGAPGNGAAGGVDAIRITVYYSVPASNFSDTLVASGYGFDLSGSTSIKGIQVKIKGYQSAAPDTGYIAVQLMKNGFPVGTPKALIQLPSSNGEVVFGNSGDLWGTTWSASEISTTDFGVAIQAVNSDNTSAVTYYIDSVKVALWAAGGPPISVTGSGSFAATQGYKYVVAYGSSQARHISTASPPSAGTGVFDGKAGVNVSLTASTDPQCDQIWVFRITDGGSDYLNIPTSPYPNVSQTVLDSASDDELDVTIQAPLAHGNDAPPAGLIKLVYHLSRIWGIVDNKVYYSAGPDVITGSGLEAFPPANVFVFPTKVNRLVPLSVGLLVFTQSDLYIINGTDKDTFYPTPYLPGLGLASYNALDRQGNNIFIYTADREFIRMSSAGFNEDGYAIGNLLEDSLDPATAYVSALTSGSTDKAVYLSDGAGSWYRDNWNMPPEGGPCWSPKATVDAGFTAIGAVETAPGHHQLLFGMNDGTVAARSKSTFSDLGDAYSASFTLDSIDLAQPGQLAELASVTVQLVNTGSVPTIEISLDEIDDQNFETLPDSVDDPPDCSPSNSIMSKRFYTDQGEDTVICQSAQIRVTFATEAVKTELFTLAVWGLLYNVE